MLSSRRSSFYALMASMLTATTTNEDFKSHHLSPRHGRRSKVVSHRKDKFASPIHAKRGMRGIPGDKLRRKAASGKFGLQRPVHN